MTQSHPHPERLHRGNDESVSYSSQSNKHGPVLQKENRIIIFNPHFLARYKMLCFYFLCPNMCNMIMCNICNMIYI